MTRQRDVTSSTLLPPVNSQQLRSSFVTATSAFCFWWVFFALLLKSLEHAYWELTNVKIPNSQIKIEFNFFHLLLTNSLWHCEWNFSPRYCPAVSQFQKLAPSYGLMGPRQQFGIQILILGAIMIWGSEGMKCVMAMGLMGISRSQQCSKAMKPSTHFLYSHKEIFFIPGKLIKGTVLAS